jgi:hypothetical protein
MNTIVPNTRPRLSRAEADKILSGFPLGSYPVKLLGVRGYYKRTMGDVLVNDRGIYDDAIFVLTDNTFKSFNANTDPSIQRGGVAVLKSGAYYLYKIGLHGVSGPKPYEALRQYGDVTVVRDGEGEFSDNKNARFWIDIHRGSYHATSSLGCQTIYPDQWEEFLDIVKKEMKRNRQVVVPYALVEQS